MQYLSTTCPSEDAKFETEIITETTRFVPINLAIIVSCYARDLTDIEKLTRVFENCKNNNIYCVTNTNNRLQLTISWDDSNENYQRKIYTFTVRAFDGKQIATHPIWFYDMLPYGRAMAILLSNHSFNHGEYEIVNQFGQIMTQLFAQHQGHSRHKTPPQTLFDKPHLCKYSKKTNIYRISNCPKYMDA